MKRYNCGCEFETDENDRVVFTVKDIENIREDCPATWNLFHRGMTRGIFQLEKNLGRKWSKEIKPNNIDELGAVISLIRPGCLKAITNGKSMTKWYADRKSGLAEVEYLHPALEPILKDTYGVLTYQEQSIKIAKDICGFDLKQADVVRRAIGKKKADLMAELKEMFINGAEKTGKVTKEEGEEIFEWIKKSERYSFNKAHAVGYATIAHWTAYCKVHFPRHFFCSYMQYAANRTNPQEEIRELINDAHLCGIEVNSPDFRRLETDFYIDGNSVSFGIGNIKQVGPAVIAKLEALKQEIDLSFEDMTWTEFLIKVSPTVGKTAVENLIDAGALDFFGIQRRRMKFEYSKFKELTKLELKWSATQPKQSFSELLIDLARPKKFGGGAANKNRIEKIQILENSISNPPFSLDDSRETIIESEDKLLGIAITYTKIDDLENYEPNATCKDIIRGRAGDVILGVIIEKMRKHTIKKGKNAGCDMAFLTVSDNSGILDDVVVFSDKFYDYEHLLVEKNAVIIIGTRSPDKDSICVNKVLQIVE